MRFCRMNEENGKNPRPAGKLWIGIGILVLLSPLGIIIPGYCGAKGAWGEWGLDQIEKLVGFVPEGMRRIAHIWRAPMTDYAVPGQGTGLGGGLGYLLAGILGVGATAGLMYLVTKLLLRRNGSSERKR
jgi:cobalt/nickel transport protein